MTPQGRGAAFRLVYHAGALGDFITTLPAIRAWRGTDPTVLLGRPAYATLADPPFEAVWDAGSALFAPLFGSAARPATRPAARLIELFAGIRSALVFARTDSPLADNLRALGVAEVLRQDPFPEERVPIVHYHFSIVDGASRTAGTAGTAGRAGTSSASRVSAIPKLAIPAQPPFPVDPSTAAIAPGSGSVAKSWPLDRFVELADALERLGMSPAWVVGPAEDGLALPAGARAWRNLPLPALAAALSRCRLYVGNDSGTTHLAAASGCPTLALFGASDPVVWAPRGRSVRVLGSGAGGMSILTLNEVLTACRDVPGWQVSKS